MEALTKLERTVLGWFKEAPHLPKSAQKWLGDNIWWIVAVGAVATGFYVLWLIISLFSNLSMLSSPFVAYYVSATFIAWAVVKTSVTLVFTALQLIVLIAAINPLRAKQKKGWVLLFGSWLISVVSVVTNAILTLSPFNFITSLIFGALWLAIGAYLIFEIHGRFAHTDHSKTVDEPK